MIKETAVEDRVATRTKGQLEASISEAIIRFEKDFMGQGPLDARSYVIDDMVLVRLSNALTPVELKLAGTKEARQARDLIKQVRMELLELGRPMLEETILELTGCSVESLHTDISTRTGERIIVFTLKGHPQLRRKSKHRFMGCAILAGGNLTTDQPMTY
jgi:uncharacterized protein YbcI